MEREGKPKIENVVTDEEDKLVELERKVGIDNLSEKDYIRLVALRLMSGNEAPENDATELATLQYKTEKVGGEDKLSKEDHIRIIALRFMYVDNLSPREVALSEEDATTLATLQYEEMHDALALSEEDHKTLIRLRKKADGEWLEE